MSLDMEAWDAGQSFFGFYLSLTNIPKFIGNAKNVSRLTRENSEAIFFMEMGNIFRCQIYILIFTVLQIKLLNLTRS